MSKLLPIAEIFVSPQGEGTWAGTLMTFIRLAGCNVGKPYTPAAREQLGLNVYQERCTDWSGSGFPCDTNYRAKMRLTEGALLVHKDVHGANRVLFTGGEPLIHDLTSLCESLLYDGVNTIHFETSGTVDFRPLKEKFAEQCWVCVSPKAGYIPEILGEADEIKVLVNNDFNEEKFVAAFIQGGVGYEQESIFISSVNGENDLNRENMNRCLALQRKYPLLRLTLQAHKVWGVR